jgi:glycosyltransferase involved in cell wall biosynthesis
MSLPEKGAAPGSAGPWDVLAFVPSLAVGGTERHIATIYPRLAQAGLKLGVVTLLGEGELAPALRAAGVDVIPLGRGYAFDRGMIEKCLCVASLAVGLFRLFRSGRVRIAHFFLPGPYLLGGTVAMLSGHSNRIMSRRSLNNYQRAHKFATLVEHFLHRRMRCATANARAALEQLIGEGAPREHCIFLPSGVDLAPIDRAPERAAARAVLGLASAPGGLTLSIVANLIPYKGHIDLIEALGRIDAQLPPDWTLLVVGRDDGSGGLVRKRAESLGIGPRVRWLGQRSDVPAILRASDIGVLASHEEALPNSLLESMAAGLPTVATSVGGVTDVATNGIDALLVPPRDPAALAAAILKLAGDGALRARIGQSARRRVESAYSLEANVNAYLRLYRLLLQEPPLSGDDIVRRFAASN